MTAQDVEALKHDADVAAWQIGYMRALIGNPDPPAKMHDSFSGFAMEVANVAVKRELALYCARAWDDAKDAISLPTLTAKLPAPSPANRARRDSYLAAYQKAKDEDVGVGLRVFRTEWLAHRVAHSKDRANFETVKPIENVTYDELVARGSVTVSLVAELRYLWTGREAAYDDHLAGAERHCREFWRVLPVLREVESG